MFNLMTTERLRFASSLCGALLVFGSSQAALASHAEKPTSIADQCYSPALGFYTGSSLHVSAALETTSIGSDRISLEPFGPPPEDAFVEFEDHPLWGRVATAVIISADEDDPEYLPTRSDSTPALRDYFVIYIEKAAAAGSDYAEYLFHSTQGLAAGYHLVHAEAGWNDAWNEPEYYFTVVDIDQPIPNNFERGATPTGLNL